MKQITSISSDPKQSMTMVLDNGDKVDIALEYISGQKGWFISIGYGEILNINGRRIVTSPNFLRAFRNMIPFGMACVAADGDEPISVDSFSGGRFAIYLLNESDRDHVEESIVPAYRT